MTRVIETVAIGITIVAQLIHIIRDIIITWRAEARKRRS